MLGPFLRLCAVAAIGVGAVLLIRSAHAGDTADSLAADPERLRKVQRLCSQDWAGTGEELCTAASRARRQRFMGPGATRYTPQPVELFPSLNQDGTPKQSGDAPASPAAPAAGAE